MRALAFGLGMPVRMNQPAVFSFTAGWGVTSGSQVPTTSHLSTCNSFACPFPWLCTNLPVRRTLHPFVNLAQSVSESHIQKRMDERVRVIGTQNGLQSFRAAPVIHSREGNSLLFSDGLDMTSYGEGSLRVRFLSKELTNCRRKPP